MEGQIKVVFHNNTAWFSLSEIFDKLEIPNTLISIERLLTPKQCMFTVTQYNDNTIHQMIVNLEGVESLIKYSTSNNIKYISEFIDKYVKPELLKISY